MNVIAGLRDSPGSHANVVLQRLLDRLGGTEILREQYFPADGEAYLQWGFKKTPALLSAIESKVPFIIVDMGYFDAFERQARMSISINGLHGTSMKSDFVLDLPPRRHPPVLDYNEEGENVLIIGQMPGDQSLRGQDIDAWMNRAAVEATEVFKKPAHKRPHPNMLNPWEPKPPPLEDVLSNAYVTINWTSTSAIASVLAGIPTVTQHPTNMAFPVCSDRIMRRRAVGREAWVHDIAHRDYNLLDDVDCDTACEYIIKALPQARAEACIGKVDAP